MPNVAAKPKKPAKATTTAASARPVHPPERAPRRLRPPRHNSLRRALRLKGRVEPPRPKRLPPAWQIGWLALKVLKMNSKLFLGITAVYTVLSLLLVHGFSSGVDMDSVHKLLGGHVGKLAEGFGQFVVLIGSSGRGASQLAGVYQTFLLLIVSLAYVWTLRQVLAGAPALRVRDAFYRGMYPLVPATLVLLTIGLQLVPLVVGTGIYGIVNHGIAVGLLENILFGLLAVVLAAASFYMVCSSVFALYIAALPDMTPLKALRSARQLVRYRRLPVLRKILFLPLALLIAAAVIMLPILLVATAAAPWAFFILTMVALPFIHAYMYSLYRELLV